jgi:hypothetical protein
MAATLPSAGRAYGRVVTRDELAAAAREVLDAAWDPAGYTAPSPERYPWQWLWDSCFHAIVWAELGDERAVIELARLLGAQDADGFVPHVLYAPHPSPHGDFWGRTDASSITQPPMHGHALAELVRRGVDVPERLCAQSTDALAFLLRVRRRHESGLVRLCHPWESGADDSPRWDEWYGGDRYMAKGELLRVIERTSGGAPIDNPTFDVACASFNALVAFNGRELASLTHDDRLLAETEELVEALDAQWDPALRTWRDAGGSSVRTLDPLVGALVSDTHVDAVLADLVDPEAYGGACGPAGVHRAEATFDPMSYWRGSAWPQLSYLLWVAAGRRENQPVADAIAAATVAGVEASGFAEHWGPDDGTPLGAVPQSWATLALLMA